MQLMFCFRTCLGNTLFVTCLALPLTVSAQQVSGLVMNPPQAVVDQPVEAAVNISGDSFYCGLIVSMGEGKTREFRVTEKDIPLKVRHQYAAPGNYAVTAEGKTLIRGLKTAPACTGKAISASVLVVPEQAPVVDKSAPAEIAALRDAANGGNPEAMYKYGNVLANGRSDKEAFTWFMAASKRNLVKAMNAVGYMYQEGRGVLQDHEEAAGWYEKAVLGGSVDALINRGLLLAKGLGTPQDKMLAYAHFSVATVNAPDANLRQEATRLRDEIVRDLSADQLIAGQDEAKKLATRIGK